jgi:ATP-binding cassette subfamily B protein
MTELAGENLEERYYDWAVFSRIVKYLKPYQTLAILSVLLLLGVSVCQLTGPYLAKITIDDHIAVGNLQGIDKIAWIFLSVLVGGFVFQFSQTLLMQYIGQNVMKDLRRETFAHIHKMSFSFFDKNPVGKLITRTVNDVEVLNEMLTSGLILIFSDLFTLIIIFLVLFYLHWKLTLVICVVFPLLAVVTHFYRVRARDALRKNRSHITSLNTFLQENLSGMKTVQLFSRETKQKSAFESINRSKLTEDLRALHYNAVYVPSIDVFSALGIGLVIWYGGGEYVQDHIQLGVLVAFIQYLNKLFEPIRDLAEKFNIIQSAVASSERIFELLDTPEETPDPVNTHEQKLESGKIEFRNVWFAYKDEDFVIKNVSFVLNAGESLAVIGATGSGKSTLINLLCKFYEPQKGEILLDDIPLSNLSKKEARYRISWVQQDPFIFSGNISDNIRLGNEEIDQEKIEFAARSLGTDRFVNKLPDKYKSLVKEKGESLSMGEKQLLSLTRALVFDPRILVLDEATSSVDTETENLIQEAIQKLVSGRTSIIIAHRLSTIKHADKVAVLKKGELIEFGLQDELIKSKGVYYKLLNIYNEK